MPCTYWCVMYTWCIHCDTQSEHCENGDGVFLSKVIISTLSLLKYAHSPLSQGAVPGRNISLNSYSMAINNCERYTIWHDKAHI